MAGVTPRRNSPKTPKPETFDAEILPSPYREGGRRRQLPATNELQESTSELRATPQTDPKSQTPDEASRPIDAPSTLEVEAEPGKSSARRLTDLVADGAALNAILSLRFVESNLGSMSATEMVKSMRDSGEAVNRGDFATAERMLNAQAVALNAIFCEMARRAASNMSTHLGATEQYMRLALKAQSQCRATLETLSAMKNPPVVFARQANIANGPQQVNNGTLPGGVKTTPRTRKTEIPPIEQSRTSHELRANPRASKATVRANSSLETMVEIDRPAQS